MHMQRISLVLVATAALIAGCTKPADDAATKPAAAGETAKAASTVVACTNANSLPRVPTTSFRAGFVSSLAVMGNG